MFVVLKVEWICIGCISYLIMVLGVFVVVLVLFIVFILMTVGKMTNNGFGGLSVSVVDLF